MSDFNPPEQFDPKTIARLHEEWRAKARSIENVDQLVAFLNDLTTRRHDYSTICYAISAAAVAAAYVVDRSPVGGITGFQYGCVLWDFITTWHAHLDGKPLRMQEFENLLYPQYDSKHFTLSAEMWEWLQTEARLRLNESRYHVSPRVLERWQSIADGVVPPPWRVEVGS